MKPSFTAHAATGHGDNDKVFNFVTPAKRWALKKKRAPALAEEVKDTPSKEVTVSPQPQEFKAAAEKTAGPEAGWQWGQQLSDWGYDPEEARASGMMGDPLWYYRMLPYLQQQGPEFSGGHLSALQARNEAIRAMISNAGLGAKEDEVPGLRRWYETLTGGTGATITNAAKGGGGRHGGRDVGMSYASALERVQASIQKANPELSDSQVYQLAQQHLGTEREFMGELGAKLISEGAPGPTLEGISPWLVPAGGAGFATRALSLPQSLTGKALYYSMNPPTTPEEVRESEMVNAALEGAQRSKELQSAQAGSSPLLAPLWALKGIEESTLGFTGSGIDEGRVDMQRALKTLGSGGTSANQILLEQLMRQKEMAQRQRETMSQGSVGSQGIRSGSELERLAERRQDRLSSGARMGAPDPETGLYSDPFAKAEAMRKNPYTNLGTLDLSLGSLPFVGKTTGEKSLLAGRWIPGNDMLGSLKDTITGGDTSHDYLMNANPLFGKDRAQGYQGAAKAVQSGKWDPRTQSLQQAGIRVADPGQQAAWYQPASWFGWRAGGRSGMDPKELRESFDANIGRSLRRGVGAERDLEAVKKNLGEEGRRAVGWDAYERDFRQNRLLGLDEMQQTKTGSAKTPLGRWLKHREKLAAENDPVLPSPEFMQEFYRQQILRRQALARRLMLPISSDERRLTDPEQTFGQGLWERTHMMGPGRNAANVLPLLRWGMTDQDLTHFDPYVQKQKEEILAGRWKPGMQLAPHARERQFGWQNPLGAIGRFLGTVPSRGQESERLIQGVISSPDYRKNMDLYHQGMISEKELRDTLGSLPSTTAKMRDANMGFGDPLEQGTKHRLRRADIKTQQVMDQSKELNDILESRQAYSFGF